MVNRNAVVAMGLGLAVAAALVGLIVLKQQGATPRLAGEITAVRTLGMDQSSSVAIVDFRLTNDSRHPFIVQSTGMTVVDGKDVPRPGQIAAASSTNQLFELFPALGAKTGETLVVRTKVAPGSSVSAMLAARFEISKAELDARRQITLSITDADGAISEIAR